MNVLSNEVYQMWKTNRESSNVADLEFCPQSTIDRIPKRWEPSSLLKNSTLSWAKALKEIYEHEMSFPGSISPSAGEILRSLVFNIAPKTVVEIGCFMGASTLFLGSALDELGGNRQLHSIDLFHSHGPNEFTNTILENPLMYVQGKIQQAGFSDFVHLRKGDSKIVGEKVGKEVSRIEFLFIDGDHTVEGCYADFMMMEKYVATGGYILFHDIFPEWCG